ncbi:hypothetical protein SAMN02745130_03742 [Thiothrix eikelboomii]|uniref:Uncharacterized protein n=1 Tax=Thiothrix eikelboomii TaxID=92487 RepID=A0A1T4Y0V7_9GAMM|nr:hypothetical protein [Thiothrix eikelboomii]SKA95263.1 hypothetical protein SAMN02745130_03742 [Thiothrix eikelboomii]
MKQSLLTALCLASVVGCVPPNAVSMDEGQMPTGQSQTVATKSALRVVGNTIYFLNAPPDKVKLKDFKDEKAINAHYTTLLSALKKRNPVQDARFAFNHGMRHFLTYNGVNVEQGRGNPLGLGSPEVEKRCPGSLTRFKQFEGVQFIQTGECSHERPSCWNYSFAVGDAYMRPWNQEMARLCWGGKLPQ